MAEKAHEGPQVTTKCSSPYCNGRVTWYGRCDRCNSRTSPVNFLPGEEQSADAALQEERNELLERNLDLEGQLAAYRIIAGKRVSELRDLTAKNERETFAHIVHDLGRGYGLSDIIDEIIPCLPLVEMSFERCQDILSAMSQLIAKPQKQETVCRTCRHRQHVAAHEDYCACKGGPYEGYNVSISHECTRWENRQPPSVQAPTGRFIAEDRLRTLIAKWRKGPGQNHSLPCPDCLDHCADELEELLKR
jgi:hypothetical protein